MPHFLYIVWRMFALANWTFTDIIHWVAAAKILCIAWQVCCREQKEQMNSLAKERKGGVGLAESPGQNQFSLFGPWPMMAFVLWLAGIHGLAVIQRGACSVRDVSMIELFEGRMFWRCMCMNLWLSFHPSMQTLSLKQIDWHRSFLDSRSRVRLC